MKTFSTYEISSIIEQNKNEIQNYIRSLSDDVILSNQDETIINNMYEKYKILPVEIIEEINNRKIEKTTIKKYNPFYRANELYEPEYYNVDGVKVTCTYTYSGEKKLFKCRASIFSLSGTPDIDVYDGYIEISAEETLKVMSDINNKNILFDKINKTLLDVKKYIGYANKDISVFNDSIKKITKNELIKRKEKADKFNFIAQMLEIPIEQSNPKIINEIRVNRNIQPIIQQSNQNIKEYCISEQVYQSILEMIKHQGSTFERTPEVYSNMKEEDLRDIILGFLNGLYKGKANGECFRKRGKTDISIEYENRAAFITECKIWAGKKVFSSALDQLQSYTTWRDNKLSLIIFSRNKDFFKVLREIKEIMPEETNYISFSELDKNEFELKLKSKNNENQILKIRIFAFDLSK